MSNKYVFDDWRSIIHFIAGLTVKPLRAISPLIPITIIICFIIYESVERDNQVKTLGDFIEFITGSIISLLT